MVLPILVAKFAAELAAAGIAATAVWALKKTGSLDAAKSLIEQAVSYGKVTVDDAKSVFNELIDDLTAEEERALGKLDLPTVPKHKDDDLANNDHEVETDNPNKNSSGNHADKQGKDALREANAGAERRKEEEAAKNKPQSLNEGTISDPTKEPVHYAGAEKINLEDNNENVLG